MLPEAVRELPVPVKITGDRILKGILKYPLLCQESGEGRYNYTFFLSFPAEKPNNGEYIKTTIKEFPGFSHISLQSGDSPIID